MARFEFTGVETEIDLAPFLADERMMRFQDELVRAGATPEDAASLSESLLTLLIEGFGEDFAEGMAENIQEMTRVRQELRSKYDAIRDTFSPDRPPVTELPPELSPEAFEQLFQRLENLMDGIENPEDFLLDRTRDANDILGDLENVGDEGAEGAGETTESEPPDVSIDAPSRTQAVVRRATAAARAFVDRAFPNSGQWRVRIVRPGRGGPASVGQFERLRGIDPEFAGQGLEVNFKGPNDIEFQPDGVQTNADGSFSFLDNKESFSDATQESGYFEGEARRELRSRLERDASIARSLRSGGARCNGWRYFTDNADLAQLMRSMAEEIRTGPEGETLFPLIEIVGPGQ